MRSRHRRGRYTLTVTQDADLDPDIRARLVHCWRATYGPMALRFNPQAARSVHLRISEDYEGAAEAAGNRITVSATHLRSYPWDSDVMTHELFHVVQAYVDFEGPYWAMEGLADYARCRYGLYNRQGGWALPEYSSEQNYTDSYRVTARFLVWLEDRYGPLALVELDRNLRAGTYGDPFWASHFGQGLDQLWSDYAGEARNTE